MTITTIVRTIEYTLDGATLAFAIPFSWFNDTWITAEVEGVALSNGADYTLAGTGEPTGTLTLASAGVAGETLQITRTVPLTQLTRFRNRGTFLADDIEEAMDTLTMIAQQLVGGSLVPSGLDAALYQLPEPDADKLIGWNSTATGLVNVDRSSIVTDGGGGGGGGGDPFDIAAFTELAETPANDDYAVVLDTSAGSHKKVTAQRFIGTLLGDARYRLAADQSFTAATEDTVHYAVESHDVLALCAFNTGTWTLTATESCRLEVHAAAMIASQSAGGSGYISIQKNSVDVAKFEDKVEADSTSRDLYLQVTDIVSLLPGDTLRVRAYSSATKNVSSALSANRLLVRELG